MTYDQTNGGDSQKMLGKYYFLTRVLQLQY